MTYSLATVRILPHAQRTPIAKDTRDMLMAQTAGAWTLADLDRLPDDGHRYELVDGDLFVTPAPSPAHEELVYQLRAILDPYAREQKVGRVYASNAAIRTGGSALLPDLLVRQPLRRPPGTWDEMPLPCLVVEILSPTTRRRDHEYKRAFYLRIGVAQYWIVDDEERTICVITPNADDVVVDRELTWRPANASAALVIDVERYFREALGQMFKNDLPVVLRKIGGSTFLSWTGPQLKSHLVLLPPTSVSKRFESIVGPMNRTGVSYSRCIEDIAMGEIGLPDIQRPFVWKNAKVRDLFDSMYRGYPVGYFLFWENQVGAKTKQIGVQNHQKVPNLLIVDGQQRLTSLYAVLKGIAVVRENYESEKIEIAFRPTDGKFEVCDAAIRKDPEYIPDISALFAPGASQYKSIGTYLEKLEAYRLKSQRQFSFDEKKTCEDSSQRLFSLIGFPFTSLQLSANIDEEQVAEVFVRINSEGKKLNESDFILTLMSVFWEEGRKELEDFCRAARRPASGGVSPFNHFLDPSPDQLLRVAIGLAFRRARLKSAYSLLRGKDMATEQFSETRRDEQFESLKNAQSHVLNLTYWHDFLGILRQSGFTGANLISSETTVYYAYIVYLIARVDLKVGANTLAQVIGRWYFMTSITLRYISSSETQMERDLAALRNAKDSSDFLSWVEREMEAELTKDFWSVTFPTRLVTSSAATPLLFAYHASLNLFDARVLFSKKRTRDVLDPSISAPKSAAERHHLFPKNYLAGLGINTIQKTNEIANYALVEWNDNIAISDTPPSEYLPKYWNRLRPKERADQAYWHALPDGWESMEYEAFLDARRRGIAKVIADGYRRLTHGETIHAADDSFESRISRGEGPHTEFKSTLRTNLQTGSTDFKMEHAVLKTLAAFLNSSGGTIFVGINDAGEAVGLEPDKFTNEDKMALHLDNLIKDRLGGSVFACLKPWFVDIGGKRVLAVECKASTRPVFLKNGAVEEFYIRAGASSPALPASHTHEYIAERFK